MTHTIDTEMPMCHPETCCCDSHGIWVIRNNGLFVSRHETEKEARNFLEILNAKD